MICQYRLQLALENGGSIPPFWAYRLYAWLLLQIPEEIAAQLHEQTRRSISQYLDHGIWVVNLLDECTVTLLGDILRKTKTIALHADRIVVRDCQCHTVEGPQAFLQRGHEICSKRAELLITSPAAFKQAGRYTIFPKEELLLQSLLMRWNEMYPEYLLDDADMLEAMHKGIHIVDYSLRTGRFRLKETAIPCFYGKIVLDARLPIVLLELWNTLLCFAPYSGIGIKTTLGMGGVKAPLHSVLEIDS